MLPFRKGAMGYAEKNLAPGETVLYRARYHWVFYRISLLLLLLAVLLGASALYAARISPEEGMPSLLARNLSIAFFALAGVHFLVRWIRASVDEYVVTTRRVIRKVGLIAREIEQAPVDKIQDITVRQGFAGRILNYGSVVLETASETGRILVPGIARPERFRSVLWGQAAGPATEAAPTRSSARERLAELEELKTRGLLSEEEYAAKRREIVSSL